MTADRITSLDRIEKAETGPTFVAALCIGGGEATAIAVKADPAWPRAPQADARDEEPKW